MWREVYDAVKRSKPDIARKMLDEKADGGWRGGVPVVYCRSDVADFLKKNMEILSPIINKWSRGSQISFQLPYN